MNQRNKNVRDQNNRRGLQEFREMRRITNGIIEPFVTRDLGPRISYYSQVGMENVLHTDVTIRFHQKF